MELELKEINRLNKQVYIGENIHHMFGKLGLLIGQRSMLAKGILDNKEKYYTNPDEFKALMNDSYNHIEKEIKELLLL